LLSWCEYVLKGLKIEIEKIDKLLDYNYLKKNILMPMINESLKLEYVTELEFQILKVVVERQIIQAKDIKEFFHGKDYSMISKQIKKLIEKKMLRPEEEGKRKYLISFDNSYLLRVIIKILAEKDFLPMRELS